MSYLDLFWTFLKIGAFTFGGGYAMLPLIQEEVIGQGWMNSSDLINFVAVSESTPGPFAVNIATYIGVVTGGVWGAIIATVGVVLPSYVIILLVAKIFKTFSHNAYVIGAMSGLKPAVIGLIASAVVTVGRGAFFTNEVSLHQIVSLQFLGSVLIFVVMMVLVIRKTHPMWLILVGAMLGIAEGYLLGLI